MKNKKLYPIPGFENYLINRNGDIYSCKYKKYLKLQIDKKGYYKLGLYKNGKRKDFTAHRLVCLTFIGKSNLQVNHKNGKKLDNRLCNLEYVTGAENMKHAFKLGLCDLSGERNNMVKLNKKQVRQIKKRLKKGDTPTNICKNYNVARKTICDIKFKRTWKNV